MAPIFNKIARSMKKARNTIKLFGAGTRRICAVAAASTAAGMAALIRAGLQETPTIEIRLDWLRDDVERRKFLKWLKKNRPRRATFVATCRRRAGGGKLGGGARRELYWLRQAQEAGCSWCDLEVETYRELPRDGIRELRLPRHILLSLHDFKRTPRRAALAQIQPGVGISAVKIAANAETIGDSIRLLSVARRQRNAVVVPMGEIGFPARILALRDGSELAYAPIETATAPGQVSLQDLKHLYRAHELNSQTQVYGVIGDPVGHSLSPLLHNTGFIARSINAVYLPLLVHDLRDFLRAIPDLGIRGFSVTIPHKQTILKHIRECDPLAAKIGAVNTVVVRRDGSLFGSNTDCFGVLRALEPKLNLGGSRVLILGAGGAARAAAFALRSAGAELMVCARRENAARELAGAAGGQAVPRRALRTLQFDAILNATPVGMFPNDNSSPLSLDELNARLVMDLIYRPQKTELLKMAARKGITTVSGVEMFVAQGTAQWELWTGRRAPESAMRLAVLKALHEEENAKRHYSSSRNAIMPGSE